MKAQLSNYRQAPRKVEKVARLIKGRSIISARAELTHLPKRAAGPILKLLNSAVANSKEDAAKLFVKTISVDKGVVLKRSMPRAMGRAFPIHKHTSHVKLELGVREEVAKKPKTKKVKV